jgi:hypothetical protein
MQYVEDGGTKFLGFVTAATLELARATARVRYGLAAGQFDCFPK